MSAVTDSPVAAATIQAASLAAGRGGPAGPVARGERVPQPGVGASVAGGILPTIPSTTPYRGQNT
jgi:hypothetical protein